MEVDEIRSLICFIIEIPEVRIGFVPIDVSHISRKQSQIIQTTIPIQLIINNCGNILQINRVEKGDCVVTSPPYSKCKFCIFKFIKQ